MYCWSFLFDLGCLAGLTTPLCCLFLSFTCNCIYPDSMFSFLSRLLELYLVFNILLLIYCALWVEIIYSFVLYISLYCKTKSIRIDSLILAIFTKAAGDNFLTAFCLSYFIFEFKFIEIKPHIISETLLHYFFIRTSKIGP